MAGPVLQALSQLLPGGVRRGPRSIILAWCPAWFALTSDPKPRI
jgi:hypothetical protein